MLAEGDDVGDDDYNCEDNDSDIYSDNYDHADLGTWMLGISSPGDPRPLLIDQQSLIKNDTEEGYSKKLFNQIKLKEETRQILNFYFNLKKTLRTSFYPKFRVKVGSSEECMIRMTFSLNKELKNWNKCTAKNHGCIRFTNGQSRVEEIK